MKNNLLQGFYHPKCPHRLNPQFFISDFDAVALNREGKILQNRTIFRNFAEEYISALVVQWIEWEIPNFQIGVRFPSEVPST